MLKEQASLFAKIAAFIDALVIVAAFVIAFWARSSAGGLKLNDFREYLWLLPVVVVTWYFLLSHFGLYASLRTRPLAQIISSLLKVHFIGGTIASSAIYFIEPRGFSRSLFGYFLILSFSFLSLEKLLLKGVLAYVRQHGYNIRNILIVGSNDRAREFIEIVQHHAAWGLKIMGVLTLSHEAQAQEFSEIRVLGQLEELTEICKQSAVDEVVFCVSNNILPNLDDYLRDMEEMGITVRVVLDFYEASRAKRELTLFHGQIPMLSFYSKAFDAGQLLVKGCLDLLGAVIGLLLTALLSPFIALAIKLDSPGPLLFGQERVGKNGRIFRCWKFRSMYVDAEERKKELLHLNEMNGAIFKIKDDPRVTPVGRFLRKTSLDELPQFWNVFMGDMSLVGTRPPTPDEVAMYENWHRKRICIKPGITGLWQVSGRNQIMDFDEVVRLDLEYIDGWSIWLDIKILLKTFRVVFARQGSC